MLGVFERGRGLSLQAWQVVPYFAGQERPQSSQVLRARRFVLCLVTSVVTSGILVSGGADPGVGVKSDTLIFLYPPATVSRSGLSAPADPREPTAPTRSNRAT